MKRGKTIDDRLESMRAEATSLRSRNARGAGDVRQAAIAGAAGFRIVASSGTTAAQRGAGSVQRQAAKTLGAAVAGTFRLTRKRPNRRQLAVSAVVLLMLLLVSWLLVRNSSLVAVKQVRVVGLSGYYDRAARRAVAAEALTMTTMNVDRDRIAAAAGEFVDVAGVRVKPAYPHGLTIFMDVRRPVAAAKIGASIYAVTGTGAVLSSAKDLTALPNVSFGGVVSKGRVTDPKALAALTVLGAAPDVLLRRVKTLKWGRTGLTLVLEKGVLLNFGSANDVTAKWRAVAAVLASDAAKGAKYIDLRVPGRPAIGGLGAAPVTPKPQPLALSPTAPTSAAPGSAAAVLTPQSLPQQAPPSTKMPATAAPGYGNGTASPPTH